jgi:hypothetical protein
MSIDGSHVGIPLRVRNATRALIVLVIVSGLAAGCGSSIGGSSSMARANIDVNPPSRSASGACAATALEALGHVAMRVYREGVASERTGAALHFIATSIPLRKAVERGDAQATRVAAEALIATGHLTNLKVMRGGQVLTDVGGPHALAPLHGTLTGAGGAPIASFVTSVWADNGFVAETDGIAEGVTALRANGQSIAGSFALPPGELPAQGTLTERGVDYQYTSFPAEAYPSGSLRVYLLRSIRSTAALCGSTDQDTVVSTLSRVATLIYAAEAGRRTLIQVHRVQHDQALLHAVARRDPVATRLAIESLLNQHVVRLRVSAGGRLLSDVGGPFVLAPVHASLHLGGRTIGSFVLSIQDDEGYLRLTHRLAGLDVLMHMGSRLVKNSLGPAPGAVPAGGSYEYRGRTFRVFTLNAKAFPSGPLRIQVLIPIPYA